MARAALMLVLAIAGIVAVPGCGQTSDEDEVKSAMNSYLTALASGDGTAACEQLTGPQARTIFQDALMQLPELRATSCADALTKLAASLGAEEKEALESAEIVNVKVDGNAATAEISGGATVAHLEKSGDGWLIARGLALGGG